MPLCELMLRDGCSKFYRLNRFVDRSETKLEERWKYLYEHFISVRSLYQKEGKRRRRNKKFACKHSVRLFDALIQNAVS